MDISRDFMGGGSECIVGFCRGSCILLWVCWMLGLVDRVYGNLDLCYIGKICCSF